MVSSDRDDHAIARHQTVNKPPAGMENERRVLPRPSAKLQIIIDETQVSVGDLPISNRTHYHDLSDSYFYTPLDPKSEGPLTFTSETLMNHVQWWLYDPPAELLFDIERIEGSAKYGLPELDTLFTTSIRADISKDQLFSAAATQKRTTALAALRETPEASSSSNTAVAGTSRPGLQTSATEEDTSSNERNQQNRVISQGSTKTNMTSDSGYMSAAERYHSKSSSNDTQHGYTKLSTFSRFRKLLKKREIKGKSVMKEPTGNCTSCLDDFLEGKMVSVECHGYCKECFERLVIAAMETETMWPVKCCQKDISHAVIMKNVNANLAQKFETKALERKVPVGDRIYCIKQGCETWIPSEWFNESLKCASCPSCNTRVCTACKGSWHANTECPKDKNLQATIRLAQERGWKKCYNCNAFVELNMGCRHIRCRCGAQWCYICRAKWLTCQCTARHLLTGLDPELQRLRGANSQTLVPTRQEAERIRRQAERDRIARQLIEDLERRQAEELEREAEFRRRREETRRGEIALTFGQIREELELLHSSQKLRLASRSQMEYRVLQEQELDLNTLRFLHSRYINQLEAQHKNEISKQEMRFLNEYYEREREEVRVEKEISQKIEAFWKDKPDAVYEIKAAKVAHQANSIAMFKKWDFDRKTALQDLAENFESEKLSLSRTQNSAMADATWKVGSGWRDWARNKVAEVKWFEAVITERESMLRTLENLQYTMATEES
ncbi:467aa7b1-e44c-4de5-8663-d2df4ac891d2 [Sclerotinia trifoliorum]|uniref:RBR-type E3 ubiquitin transferase n=1 Tax=Sclerotinia trifoliorum TaxID=28548 RepID=A0A8H2ZXV2_9HELO|nr:467aa7b1-e44c-4de5-8663-d2df4ac891d2 [Sclerotinia trifoliorum]